MKRTFLCPDREVSRPYAERKRDGIFSFKFKCKQFSLLVIVQVVLANLSYVDEAMVRWLKLRQKAANSTCPN